jgi:dethiobiotin synthetase
VASGCSIQGNELFSDDAFRLWTAAGRRCSLSDVCPQKFLAPISPHLAARQENKRVDERLLVDGIARVSQDVDLVVVEGAGGLMSPLSDDLLNGDLAKALNAEIILVVANRLGAIHQALATLSAAAALKLPVIGCILNQALHQDANALGDISILGNASSIKRFTQTPLLAELEHQATSTDIQWNSLPQALVPTIT